MGFSEGGNASYCASEVCTASVLDLFKESTIKRIKEITIIHYRKRSQKKTRLIAGECCPLCGSTDLITVMSAVQLTGVSKTVLDDWIANNKVHAVILADGKFRVCCRSLSEQIASDDDGMEKEKPNLYLS